MKASIYDSKALTAISPLALSAYARAAGWTSVESYGDHSDVYAAPDLPEIILPRTHLLGDYVHIVSQLIEIFAREADVDEISIYRELVTSDRDVIRIRADGPDDGSVAIRDGISLVSGARDMVLAAACSLRDPRPAYRLGANKEANDYLSQVRLGQTEQGSFAIVFLTPVISPPLQAPLDSYIAPNSDPIERQMTRRLSDALMASRKAVERAIGGDTNAFPDAVAQGVSANLCEALVTLIEPFSAVDVSLVWARTRPMDMARNVIRFTKDNAPILDEAARVFRSREPRLDTTLYGFVQRLKRDDSEIDGTITLRALIDDTTQSVTAVLDPLDYERAIHAHRAREPVIAEGDLERRGQRWHLSNPRIVGIVETGHAQDAPDGE